MVKGDDNIEEMVEEREKKKIAARRIAEFRKTLNERELYIFEHRIMTDEPMTLQAIGDHFNISRERARQIEKVLSDKVSKSLIGRGKDGAGKLAGRERAGLSGLRAAPPAGDGSPASVASVGGAVPRFEGEDFAGSPGPLRDYVI